MKFLRLLLFPFSVIYNCVTIVRNLFFDVGFFKQTSYKIPIIVVGNLSVGGTGKTPQIEYLIRLLKGKYNIAVLSRGYKRKTKGYVLLNKHHTAEDVGDEPLQYFKKFDPITIAVDANRVEGVSNLIKKKAPEIILLDDAFQHRKIKGSFYILLTKFNDLFVDDYLLPTGNLRESRKGAKRANIIIVTKCPENLEQNQQKEIKTRLAHFNKAVFFTAISYGAIISGDNKLTIDELKNYEVLLVTGIANPIPLVEFMSDNDVVFKHLKYADHHQFSIKEVNGIHQEFYKIKSNHKLILTTEKDYVRLQGKVQDLYHITIETKFLGNQKFSFEKEIIAHITENRC